MALTRRAFLKASSLLLPLAARRPKRPYTRYYGRTY